MQWKKIIVDIGNVAQRFVRDSKRLNQCIGLLCYFKNSASPYFVFIQASGARRKYGNSLLICECL